MDILIFSGGDQERIRFPRKVKKLLHDRPHERPPDQLTLPLAQKRLYIPAASLPKRDVQSAVEDMYALPCIYLLQEELIHVDEDHSVREFLCAYVRKFQGARRLGVEYVLWEMLTRYQIPEDYRALRKYMGKTIRGLVANQQRQESSDFTLTRAAAQTVDLSNRHEHDADSLDDSEEQVHSHRPGQRQPVRLEPSNSPDFEMIPAAAASLGIPVRSLYALVEQGKVRTETVIHGSRPYLMIPDAEMERLKGWLAQKQLRKVLIEGLAASAGITEASARRWVERQEKKGLRIEEICQRVRDRL
jgi:hypothetical protein